MIKAGFCHEFEFNPSTGGRQVDPWVRGYPNLPTEFQDSPGNTEKACLKNKK